MSVGRPRGARNRLSRSFLEELTKDFEANGAAAIQICRIETPQEYLRIIASTMPKLFEHETGLAELDDETLERMKRMLLAGRSDEVLELRPQPVPIRAINDGRSN